MRISLLAASLAVLSFWITVTPLRSEVLVRISEDEVAHQVIEFGGRVWVALESGAFYVKDNSLAPVWRGKQVNTINSVHGEIWLGTEAGVFRVVGEQTYPQLTDQVGTPWVMSIQSTPDGVTWLGTDRGVFRVEGKVAQQTAVKEIVYTIEIVDTVAWAGTAKGAYRFDEFGTPEFLSTEGGPRAVSGIVVAADSTWLITNVVHFQYGPCFRVGADQSPTPIRGLENSQVTSLAAIDGEPWFGTTNGVYHLQEGHATRIDLPRISEPINAVSGENSEVWLGTTERAYRMRLGQGFEPIPIAAHKLGITGITSAAGKTWIWGETGAYRLDEDVEIKVETTAASFLGLLVTFGRTMRIAEMRYDRNGQDPYDGTVKTAFAAIMETNTETFNLAVQEGGFAPAKSLERTVPYGLQTLYLVAQDAYGNTTEHTRRNLLVLPTPWLLLGFVALISLILILILNRARISRVAAAMKVHGMDAGGLEQLTSTGNPFVDTAPLARWLVQVERQVCQVRCGDEYGTGFLVAPDLVMTCYHVVWRHLDGEVPAHGVKVRFDYRADTSGKEPSDDEGSWLDINAGSQIHYSRHSQADVDLLGDPTPHELDYAVLRLQYRVGNEPPPGETAPRGWVDLSSDLLLPKPDSPILIVQHPGREVTPPPQMPLQITFATPGFESPNANGTRVKYKPSTRPGSSGSPVYDRKLRAVALHHNRGQINPDAVGLTLNNRGIPLARIRADLPEEVREELVPPPKA